MKIKPSLRKEKAVINISINDTKDALLLFRLLKPNIDPGFYNSAKATVDVLDV